MARKANAEAIAQEAEGPDYVGACVILRDRIKAKKDKVAGINGEVSGLYDQIEKKGVNKIGARMFLTLDGKEDDERKDILRTITKLAEAAGWNDGGDMVDKAEGTNVVRMPGAKSDKADSPGDGEGEAQGEKLDPAGFKSVVVERLTERSDLTDAEAYPVAGTVFDGLTTEEKSNMTRELAIAKADAEMEDWESDTPGSDA